MAARTLEFWKAVGARFVTIVPAVQLNVPDAGLNGEGLFVLGDAGGDLKEWFGNHRASLVVLRPDRFVAASARSPQLIDGITRRLQSMMHAESASWSQLGPDESELHLRRHPREGGDPVVQSVND
jgi:3-(3-hydroxy-phenyl)propionate hydroxylase